MSKVYDEDSVELHHGDCLAVMASMPENSIDTIITDPPYELGFMGKAWDRSGVAFRHETWRAALRVAKPGAFLLAFGGTRTWHRLACAIEDAGWELRDTIAWMFGSGFPKSLDISKAIDKRGPNVDYVAFPEFAKHYAQRRRALGKTHAQICELGHFYGTVNHGGTSANWESGLALPTVAQWEVVAPVLGLDAKWRVRVVREEYEREVLGHRKVSRGVAFSSDGMDSLPITAPACHAAKLWNGWGTSLKPAFEPILVAMKPLDGTFAENALKHGVAGLNIDGGRIHTKGSEARGYTVKRLKPGATLNKTGGNWRPEEGGEEYNGTTKAGRWPANLILDESAAALLDSEVGELTSGMMKAGTQRAAQDEPGSVCYGTYGGDATTADTYADSGGPSRFFYTAKASRSDRGHGNTHPTVKPTDLMKYLCKLTATPTGGVILDPFAGSGTTLVAAREYGRPCIGIELEEDHCRIIVDRLRQGHLFGAAS